MKMWIARDNDGRLFLYPTEPKRFGYNFVCRYVKGDYMQINCDSFHEVTFENSPMEVELKLIENGTDK